MAGARQQVIDGVAELLLTGEGEEVVEEGEEVVVEVEVRALANRVGGRVGQGGVAVVA